MTTPGVVLALDRAVIDVAIVCHDFERSLRFYRDTLGFEVAEELDVPASFAIGAGLAPASFHHTRLRAGNTLIKLMQIDPHPAQPAFEFAAGVRWLTFFVPDVDKLYRSLLGRGVEFLNPPMAAPDAAAVVCAADPDNVILEFVQVDPWT